MFPEKKELLIKVRGLWVNPENKKSGEDLITVDSRDETTGNQIIFAFGLLGGLVLILLPVYGRDDPSRPQISFVFPVLHRVLFWFNS